MDSRTVGEGPCMARWMCWAEERASGRGGLASTSGGGRGASVHGHLTGRARPAPSVRVQLVSETYVRLDRCLTKPAGPQPVCPRHLSAGGEL